MSTDLSPRPVGAPSRRNVGTGMSPALLSDTYRGLLRTYLATVAGHKAIDAVRAEASRNAGPVDAVLSVSP